MYTGTPSHIDTPQYLLEGDVIDVYGATSDGYIREQVTSGSEDPPYQS